MASTDSLSLESISIFHRNRPPRLRFNFYLLADTQYDFHPSVAQDAIPQHPRRPCATPVPHACYASLFPK